MTTTHHPVPARGGLAVLVPEGATVRVVTPSGAQAVDFWAVTPSGEDWLSPMHTWVTTRSLKLRVGDTLLSRFRLPMMELVEDGADGCHDMLIAACDQTRYEQFGEDAPHPNCSDNFRNALARLGRSLPLVPQPVNLFTHTRVDADGRLLSPPNPVPPGSHVLLRALREIVCVVSACPFDLPIEGWTINAPGGPTAIELEVRT